MRGSDWKIALCSLSIGRSTAPLRLTACMNSAPDITSASLLASSTRLPASTAARVDGSPAAPTMAAITMSTSGALATSHNACSPNSTRVRIPAAASEPCKAIAAACSGTTA